MQNDIRVLNNTIIGSFIDFLENDPFLIHCRADKHKIELPVEINNLKRIRDAENILKDEGMGDVVKLNVGETPRRLQECRSSRLFLKEETKQLALEIIKGDIEEQILQYSLLVPENIQNCLGKPENAYSNALGMRYPGFLWGKIDKEIIGLVSLNLENQKCMHKRLYISHLSFLQVDMLEKFLEILIQYI